MKFGKMVGRGGGRNEPSSSPKVTPPRRHPPERSERRFELAELGEEEGMKELAAKEPNRKMKIKDRKSVV